MSQGLERPKKKERGWRTARNGALETLTTFINFDVLYVVTKAMTMVTSNMMVTDHHYTYENKESEILHCQNMMWKHEANKAVGKMVPTDQLDSGLSQSICKKFSICKVQQSEAP